MKYTIEKIIATFVIATLATPAMAADAPAQGSPLSSLLFLGVIFLVMYWLMMRPQQKKAKEHRELVSALSVGDEVITSGGLVGKVAAVHEAYVEVTLADTVTTMLQRQAVSAVLPKGSINAITK